MRAKYRRSRGISIFVRNGQHKVAAQARCTGYTHKDEQGIDVFLRILGLLFIHISQRLGHLWPSLAVRTAFVVGNICERFATRSLQQMPSLVAKVN